jgi:hypothetical protein
MSPCCHLVQDFDKQTTKQKYMKEKLSSLISKTICFKFSDHLKIYQMLRCLSHCWKSLILNLKQMQVCNTDFSNGQDHWKLFIFPNYCFQLQYRLSSSNPNNEPSMYTPRTRTRTTTYWNELQAPGRVTMLLVNFMMSRSF